MISPTVGRQVWFFKAHPDKNDVQPEAATVVYVWNSRSVNLQVISHDGVARAELEVTLLQDDDKAPLAGRYAEWMPFQKGQAKMQEQLPSSPESSNHG